jgi:SpoIID/LytB domain protein
MSSTQQRGKHAKPRGKHVKPAEPKNYRKGISRGISAGALIAVSAGMLAAAPANAATAVPDSFTVNGSGWGHGVGMSQYGALGMAQEGYSATQILEHYYNPAKVNASTANASTDIKVQLLKTGSTTITPTNGKLRVFAGSSVYETTGPVTLSVNSGKVSFKVNGMTATSATVNLQWEGTRYWPVSGKATTVSIPGADNGGTGVYRNGRLEVGVIDGQVNIVNSLRLNDEYLYGLAEVPSSWDSAALQAQAIAGRTYAMRNMGSLKPGCGCNVYDEVLSQKFSGWTKENEGNGSLGAKWKAAVDATQTKNNGVPVSASVITYNGALIDAVYSSSTGGMTRSGASVWGTQTPYLQSRDDHWALKSTVGNPNASWNTSFSQSQMASGFGLPNVVNVSVARNADGTIQSATAKSSTGAVSTLSGSQFMTKFPIRAHWVLSVNATGTSSTPDTVIGTAKTVDAVNFRSGPSTSYTSYQMVAGGTTVNVLGGSVDGWTKVSYGGKVGYISTPYLISTVPVATPPAPAPVVNPVIGTANAIYGVNFRTGPSTNDSIILMIPQGAKVNVLAGSVNGWTKVSYDGKTGYVSSPYLTATAPVSSSPAYIGTATTLYGVNFRTGPSTNDSIILMIPQGAKVNVVSASVNGWTKVSYDGKTGYVSSPYLTATVS